RGQRRVDANRHRVVRPRVDSHPMEVNSMSVTGLNEFGRLRRVVMKHPREAFVDEQTIAREWRALNFTAPPDFGRAVEEYESLLVIISGTGAEISFLPARSGTG